MSDRIPSQLSERPGGLARSPVDAPAALEQLGELGGQALFEAGRVRVERAVVRVGVPEPEPVDAAVCRTELEPVHEAGLSAHADLDLDEELLEGEALASGDAAGREQVGQDERRVRVQIDPGAPVEARACEWD